MKSSESSSIEGELMEKHQTVETIWDQQRNQILMCIRFKRMTDSFFFGIGADVYLLVCLQIRAHTRRHTVGQHIKFCFDIV